MRRCSFPTRLTAGSRCRVAAADIVDAVASVLGWTILLSNAGSCQDNVLQNIVQQLRNGGGGHLWSRTGGGSK
eukprot:SAG22_NODE_1572_length_4093_cov_18.988733_5_plen_73_part_00